MIILFIEINENICCILLYFLSTICMQELQTVNIFLQVQTAIHIWKSKSFSDVTLGNKEEEEPTKRKPNILNNMIEKVCQYNKYGYCKELGANVSYQRNGLSEKPMICIEFVFSDLGFIS